MPYCRSNRDSWKILSHTQHQIISCNHWFKILSSVMRCATLLVNWGSQGCGAHFRGLRRVMAIFHIYEANHARLFALSDPTEASFCKNLIIEARITQPLASQYITYYSHKHFQPFIGLCSSCIFPFGSPAFALSLSLLWKWNWIEAAGM